jgi:hypothetical protein
MADMADREELLDVELFDRIDHPLGISKVPPATPALCIQFFWLRFLPAGSVRINACRPYHVDHTGDEAEQNEHDESEGRCRQQTVETPANQRPDDNTRDQLRGKPETARHRRGSGSTVSASCFKLVSPDFAAVPDFGQPVVQTSEPCGKRSFVGGRLIATSICAVVRAARHDVETRNETAVVGNDAPSPSKAARTILTASKQVKIAS